MNHLELTHSLSFCCCTCLVTDHCSIQTLVVLIGSLPLLSLTEKTMSSHQHWPQSSAEICFYRQAHWITCRQRHVHKIKQMMMAWRHLVTRLHSLPNDVWADTICWAFFLLQGSSHHKPTSQNHLSSCFKSLAPGHYEEMSYLGPQEAAAHSRASPAPILATSLGSCRSHQTSPHKWDDQGSDLTKCSGQD